jgi:hypothetical protein
MEGWYRQKILHLSPEESAYVELKLELSKILQETRRENELTQEQ